MNKTQENVRVTQLVTIFVIVTIVLGSAWPVRAGTPPIMDDPGADVVILVDQSGSMSGVKVHPKANDPDGLRVDMVGHLVLRLFGGSCQRLATGVSRSYRVTVIEFGDTARVAAGLDWFAVRFDSTDTRSDQAKMSSLQQQYGARLDRHERMGYTHHLDAIRLAEEQLARINWGRDGPHDRRLAIILVTDGQYYVKDSPYYVSGNFQAGLYRRDLEDELDRLTRTLTADRGLGLDFVVVGLADRVRGSADWKNTESMWDKYADEVYTIADPQSLPFALDSLTARLTGLAQITPDGSLALPCYISKIRLTVFHLGPMSQFGIRDPSGAKVDLPSHFVTQGLRYRVYEIEEPEPGIWKLEGNKQTYQSRFELYYQRVMLKTPSPHLARIPKAPVRFRWSVQSADSEPFKPQPGCSLVVRTIVTESSGIVDTIGLTPQDGQPGMFRAVSEWTPSSSGRCVLKLEGMGILPTGSRQIVFESAPIEITVSDRTALVGELIEPTTVRRSMDGYSGEVRLRMRSLSQDKQAPSLRAITDRPDGLILFQIKSKDDSVLQDARPLIGHPESAPAEFVGSVDFPHHDLLQPRLELPFLSDEVVRVCFQVQSDALDDQFDIYGFGEPPYEDWEVSVPVESGLVYSLVLTLVAALALYLAANLVYLLFDLGVWLLTLTADYARGVRRLRLAYQKELYDSRLYRSIQGRHRYDYGEVAWSRSEKVFVVRGLLIRLLMRDGQVPFKPLMDDEVWPLQGMTIRRRPFGRTVRVRLFPRPKVIDPADEGRSLEVVKREKDAARIDEMKQRRKVYELGLRRMVRLPRNIGRLGLDSE